MARGKTNRSQETIANSMAESKSNVIKIRSDGAIPVRIREGAGTDHAHINGKYLGKGIFDVDEVVEGPGSKSGWGHLTNGDGWVALDFVEILK